MTVERQQHRVRSLEPFQPATGVRTLQHRVAERRRELLEDGRAHQEAAVGGRPELADHLGAQVVDDEAIGRRRLGRVLERRERSQVQAGGPALGLLARRRPLPQRSAPRRRVHRRVAPRACSSPDSAGPISTRRSSARIRATGSAGSLRPASATVDPAGSSAMTSASSASADAARAGRRRSSSSSNGSSEPLPCPMSARACCDVVRSSRGSASSSLAVSHAAGRGSRSAHCASSVVLPYPAAAVTATSGASQPTSRLSSAVRGTSPRRKAGGRNLAPGRGAAPRWRCGGTAAASLPGDDRCC